jgi:hypothetical protein
VLVYHYKLDATKGLNDKILIFFPSGEFEPGLSCFKALNLTCLTDCALPKEASSGAPMLLHRVKGYYFTYVTYAISHENEYSVIVFFLV